MSSTGHFNPSSNQHLLWITEASDWWMPTKPIILGFLSETVCHRSRWQLQYKRGVVHVLYLQVCHQLWSWLNLTNKLSCDLHKFSGPSGLLYAEMHFMRLITTSWDSSVKLIKPVHLIRYLLCNNKIRFRTNADLQRHFVLSFRRSEEIWSLLESSLSNSRTARSTESNAALRSKRT